MYSDTELLKRLQVAVEGLDVCKHTHGVRLGPHRHHVLHLDQTETVSLLLCGGEGQLQVVFAVCRFQRVVIEVQREERVHQSTESHPIAPAGRVVLDIYVLIANGF